MMAAQNPINVKVLTIIEKDRKGLMLIDGKTTIMSKARLMSGNTNGKVYIQALAVGTVG